MRTVEAKAQRAGTEGEMGATALGAARARQNGSPAGRRGKAWGWVKRGVIGVLAVAALAVGGTYGRTYWRWSEGHESTDNAFIDGPIAQVSARVAGHVAKVLVSDNQLVHAGDVLLELDPRDYQAALDEAHGKLAAARADRTAARSQVSEAQAGVEAAEAAVAQAEAAAAAREAEAQKADDDLARYAKARESAAVSSLEWNAAVAAQRVSRAALNAAQKGVAAAKAQVGQARAGIAARQAQVTVCEAQVRTAQAAVDRAQRNLSYTQVRAAADGRVTRKSVEPGNSVLAGQPLFALVGTEIWVTANFKETQLAHMRVGQAVTVAVDAYPGLALRGHVDSIQQGAGARFSLLPPENATGNYVKVVQRVPVKIVLDEQPGGGRVLGPGMSVVPVVETKTTETRSHEGTK